MTSTACIILAAGEGTRMKSRLPKVMHKIAGRSMLAHVMAVASGLGPERVTVVAGPDMELVSSEVERMNGDAAICIQEKRLGTGDAVKRALPSLSGFDGAVLVLYGDTPLITADALKKLHDAISGGAAVAVLGFHAQNPTGYGRLLVDPNNGLLAIREEADANKDEKAIRLCNSGVMAFDGALLPDLIASLGNDNAKGEYYLTDTVKAVHDSGRSAVVVECDETDVLGVNSREQLAAAEAAIQNRLRGAALSAGATLIAPETVYFSHDTTIGRDVTIEPNVFFGEGVQVGDDVHIKAFCHLEGSVLDDGSEIGPHARLRPGTRIGQGAKIGNFVEVKNTSFGAGAKANHLSYVGDSIVGELANIGAGTITCNYDGFKKSKTHIGANAFIGSNSSLVAPVSIGAGAYIGSSSVITHDVPEDALALTRAPHKEILDWASRRTKQNQKKK